MNMKLSYRDKVIFIVVIVLIILAVGFFVFVKAKIQESKDVQANLEVKQQELDEVHAKIDTLEPLKKQLENDVKEVDELQEPFMDEQLTYQADQYIYELLSEVPGVSFNSMSLSGESESEISPYYYERNALSYDLKMNSDLTGDSLDQDVYNDYYDTYPDEPDDVDIAVETVTLELVVPASENGTADWDTIMAIFDKIAEHDKTIYLKEFSGGDTQADVDGAEQNMSSITIVVDVFSITKMDTSKLDG